MTPAQREAYLALSRRLDVIKAEVEYGMATGDETAAEIAHTELIEIEHALRELEKGLPQ